MTTFTAAAPPKQASFSMLKELKPKLVANVLEFLDLTQKLQVSGTCKMLRRTVNKDCSCLWEHLDFSTLSPSIRSNLTDKSLAGLLKRVHAKRVTKSIILAGCDNVNGSGLSPCRRSPILEYVDLRRDTADGDDERKAVRELRTMIRFKLVRVRFNEPLPTYACGVSNFLRDLEAAAKLKQGQQCIGGNGVVASLGECGVCKEIVSCGESWTSVCATCDTSFCSYCTETQGCIFPCFSCNKQYCDSCRDVRMCDDCETYLCEECLQVKRCGYCSGFFCVRCRDVASMDNGTGGTVDVCSKCQDKMAELL